MRVEPDSGRGGSSSDANELLRSLVSGTGTVDQSTREELRRLLSDGYASEPAPETEPAPAPRIAAPSNAAPKAIASQSASQSMEARRLAGMAYVRRMRISAR